MTAWLSRLIPTRRAPPPARREPVAVIAPAGKATCTLHAEMLTGGQSSSDLAFLVWLLQSPADAQAPLGAREEQALHHLSRLVADPGAHAHLLPRAAAVVPQLLARLRAASSSLSDLEQLVSRDITLVAEVIGMANSPYYRRGAAVVELAHAIQVLGIEGLRATIARVVLKPLIDARGGELVARSARRLWTHTDRKAQLCAALARGDGADPLDAYVLALAHNAAWNVTLRAMDMVAGSTPWRLGTAFVAALAQRRDQLLAIIAMQWHLPEGAARVAADVGERGLTPEASAHVVHLYAGDRLASLLCLHDSASATALASGLLDAAGAPAQACFRAFTPSPEAPSR
ncbi:MAG: HDOD domain-containing protein [Aquincola sp.]|nr:HDOD domain-containing protein [Aquincola sp.]MDH5328633.1 HDOD domain-containing protein [Aquincola sp.]